MVDKDLHIGVILDIESSNDVYHENIPIKQIVPDRNEDSVISDLILWDNYKNYLALKVSRITASNLFRYARKYYYILTTQDASDLQILPQEKRIHVMNALSSLSKFLGIHKDWKKLIQNFDLKWTNSETANNIFFRIFDNHNNGNIHKMISWVKEAMAQLPKNTVIYYYPQH